MVYEVTFFFHGIQWLQSGIVSEDFEGLPDQKVPKCTEPTSNTQAFLFGDAVVSFSTVYGVASAANKLSTSVDLLCKQRCWCRLRITLKIRGRCLQVETRTVSSRSQVLVSDAGFLSKGSHCKVRC